jgi:nitrogen-specific signal transduction histidine kinase/ActR/RegA family two-component response regulator
MLLVFVALLRPQQRALTQALRTLDARHRDLHAQIAEAEASQRKKARFLATMSHELRNPLSGIIGVADLLDHTRLDDVQKTYVSGLRTSSDHLLGLVNNVLDYTRIDSGKLELDRGQVDPRVCVHEVLQITEALAQTKGIALRSEIAPGTPARFIGDATRLRQILLNLVSNAIKFTERGTVTLATALEGVADGHATLVFRVSDTGVGVPPERLPSLFDTFTQLDASTAGKHGGSGLGLAIVRRLAKAMNGELTATSKPGEGSTFSLRIPIELPAEYSTTASWSHASMIGQHPPLEDFASDHPRRILAVEDEPVNRMVLEAMLLELGYTPTMASDGREALRAVDARAFDLVLMDMRMPELDGSATTRAIRERLGRDAPFIIAVTAAAESEATQAGDRFDAYLGKPVTLERLKEALAASPEPTRASASTSDALRPTTPRPRAAAGA